MLTRDQQCQGRDCLAEPGCGVDKSSDPHPGSGSQSRQRAGPGDLSVPLPPWLCPCLSHMVPIVSVSASSAPLLRVGQQRVGGQFVLFLVLVCHGGRGEPGARFGDMGTLVSPKATASLLLCPWELPEAPPLLRVTYGQTNPPE